MSATLNADLFSEYFNGCPVIDIPGKSVDHHTGDENQKQIN